MFRFKSQSRPAQSYIVSKPNGIWDCTCPHYIYRLSKHGGRCKHIDQAIQLEKIAWDPTYWELDFDIAVPQYAIPTEV